MKNFKNTVAAFTMMVVMGFGATMANAGLLVSDRGINTCTVDDKTDLGGILVSDLGGLIVSDLTGIIVLGRTDGIIVLGRGTPDTPAACESK